MSDYQAHPRRRAAGITAAFVLLALVTGGCDSSSLPFGAQPTTPPVIVIATAAPGGTAASPPAAPTQVAEQPVPTAVPEQALPSEEALPPTEPPSQPAPSGGSTLEVVRGRGKLLCGANADLPGFGFYDSVRQRWSGFDVDFCRAVAAAVLGDAQAVEFVALDTAGARERFAAVRDGSVDVLFRNTTWTLGRDIAGLAFGPTTFHDGQTFMVRTSAGVSSLDALQGKRICVTRGTTSEQNLNDDFGARGITFEAVPFDDEKQLYAAYDEGQCDAVTSDSSQLASKKEALQNPGDHVILGDRISREPLGPVFREGDERWHDVVAWAVFATMYAEELRVSQANVEQSRDSSDPRVRRLLGIEGEFGQGLGIPNDFGYQIVRQIGNYGDIYDRNLGPSTPFALERGPNKAWNLGGGGVLASPPFR